MQSTICRTDCCHQKKSWEKPYLGKKVKYAESGHSCNTCHLIFLGLQMKTKRQMSNTWSTWRRVNPFFSFILRLRARCMKKWVKIGKIVSNKRNRSTQSLVHKTSQTSNYNLKRKTKFMLRWRWVIDTRKEWAEWMHSAEHHSFTTSQLPTKRPNMCLKLEAWTL